MGHFYDKDTAEPRYFVNGRDATLRDARKFGWIQSVNETTAIIAKPALNDYFVKEGAKYALQFPKLADEDMETYLRRILDGSKKAGKAAAEEGDRIHNAIEASFKGEPIPDQYGKHVEAARAEVRRLFPDVSDWIAEKTFVHPLGFAGKCDLHSPSTGIVVDWKSKDGDFTEVDAYGKPKKLAWDQNVQLAAYQVGLGLNGIEEYRREMGTVEPSHHVQCANIFVSRTHPGKVASHVWSAEDIAYGWQLFEAALALWKITKRYDGSF